MHLETGVELDRGSQKRIDNVGVVIELLVDHKGKDTHLSSTTVVELLGTGIFLLLGGVVEGHEINTEISGSGAFDL